MDSAFQSLLLSYQFHNKSNMFFKFCLKFLLFFFIILSRTFIDCFIADHIFFIDLNNITMQIKLHTNSIYFIVRNILSYELTTNIAPCFSKLLIQKKFDDVMVLNSVTGEIRNVTRNDILWIIILDSLKITKFTLYGFGSGEKIAYLNIYNV